MKCKFVSWGIQNAHLWVRHAHFLAQVKDVANRRWGNFRTGEPLMCTKITRFWEGMGLNCLRCPDHLLHVPLINQTGGGREQKLSLFPESLFPPELEPWPTVAALDFGLVRGQLPCCSFCPLSEWVKIPQTRVLAKQHNPWRHSPSIIRWLTQHHTCSSLPPHPQVWYCVMLSETVL